MSTEDTCPLLAWPRKTGRHGVWAGHSFDLTTTTKENNS